MNCVADKISIREFTNYLCLFTPINNKAYNKHTHTHIIHRQRINAVELLESRLMGFLANSLRSNTSSFSNTDKNWNICISKIYCQRFCVRSIRLGRIIRPQSGVSVRRKYPFEMANVTIAKITIPLTRIFPFALFRLGNVWEFSDGWVASCALNGGGIKLSQWDDTF